MHELGIAQNIVEIVQQSVPRNQAPAVKVVKLKVGRLAGIVPDSLEFCFSVLVGDSDLKGAKLHIEQTATVGRCKDCSLDFPVKEYEFFCPSCKTTNIELISGTELEITEIELSDEPREAV
jgi:hydrogenase nickel incorporation protein HypA/HybF